MTQVGRILKWLVVFVVTLAIAFTIFIGYRFITERPHFESAEALATKMIQTRTFEFPGISKTRYNPFTRTYFVYFRMNNGEQMLVKINMASRNENGELNQCTIVETTK